MLRCYSDVSGSSTFFCFKCLWKSDVHLPEVNVAMCCMHWLNFFSFRKLQSFLETHANGPGFDVDSAFLVVLT